MRFPEHLQDRSTWSMAGHCPIEKALGVVGTRSAMLILREAFYGTARFDDFVDRVEMAPATASTKLKALVDVGALERRPYREEGGRTREEYALTAAGKELLPVIVALYRWGRDHADREPALDLVHLGCGEELGVEVTCSAGHPITQDDLELRRTAKR
jgi:DNA-binding HxlR family transcriptional regulator